MVSIACLRTIIVALGGVGGRAGPLNVIVSRGFAARAGVSLAKHTLRERTAGSWFTSRPVSECKSSQKTQ